MDKNNDIQVNKVNKWEAAPKNMGTLFTYIDLVIGMACSLPSEIRVNLYDLMDKTFDEYNELEAKYQEACGMISEYEEENRNLKSELDIKTDECDALISRVFKQDEEYTELKKENKELRETRELLNEVNSKQCAEVDDLEADIRDLEVQVRVNKGIASLYESEIKQVIDLAKTYGLIIHDDRKDDIPDDVANIGMCGHYYVLGGRVKEEPKDIQKLEKKWKNAENTIKELMQVLNYEHIDVSHSKSSWTIHNRALSEKTKHFDMQLHNLRDEIRIRCEEIDGKNKLIDELNSEIRSLKLCMNMKFSCYGYGLNSVRDELNRKIETLEKENKELKDALNVDGEFGKYVGKYVADSIQEGWKYGTYELHPYTRIDIHVEETKNTSMSFNRYSIPNVAVMFNNTQTEMERDTAEHECEELDRKFKELVKENEELRMTLTMCERDANMAQSLCRTIAFNAERAKNKTPWFNE